MGGQRGFWDIEERYALLSKAGDPLERLAAVVPWEVFRKPLAKALKRSDGIKGWSSFVSAADDVQDTGVAGTV